ncbi:MAG: hypothetical protein ACKO37_00690 [Vampirovibrionales bacterium]
MSFSFKPVHRLTYVMLPLVLLLMVMSGCDPTKQENASHTQLHPWQAVTDMLLDVRDTLYDRYQAWQFEQHASKTQSSRHAYPNASSHTRNPAEESSHAKTVVTDKGASQQNVELESWLDTWGLFGKYLKKLAIGSAAIIETFYRGIGHAMAGVMDALLATTSATQEGIRLAPVIPSLHDAHMSQYDWTQYHLPYRDISEARLHALSLSLKRAFSKGWLTLYPDDETPEGYTFRPDDPLTDLEWQHFSKHWPGVYGALPFPQHRLGLCKTVMVQLKRRGQFTLPETMTFDTTLDFIEHSKPASAKSEETIDAVPDFYETVGSNLQAQQALAFCYGTGVFEAVLGSELGSPASLLSQGLHPYHPLTRAESIKALEYLQSLY